MSVQMQENATTVVGVTAPPKFEQIDLIIALSVNGVLLTWTLWLVISVLVYGIRTKRFIRRSSNDFNGGIVFTFALLSIILLAARITSTILLVVVPPYFPNDWPTCGVLYDVTVTLYVVALVPVYLLLWLRQRVLYSHPTMSQLHSKGMRFLSWSSLAFLIGAAIVLVTLFAYPDNIGPGYYGCVVTEVGSSIVPNVLTASTLVLGQSMLLALFIIPLRAQSMSTKRATSVNIRSRRFSTRFIHSMRRVTSRVVYHTGAARDTAVNTTEFIEVNGTSNTSKGSGDRATQSSSTVQPAKAVQKKRRSVDRIRRVLFRSVFFGAICMVSDVATLGLVTFAFKNTYPKNIPFVIYDLSLFVNVMSVIFSFDNYQAMIVSPCFGTKRVKKAVTELSSRQQSGGSENG